MKINIADQTQPKLLIPGHKFSFSSNGLARDKAEII
jgi:hypothetical protein